MKKLVKPSAISGVVVAPASKSVAQRAIAMAAMAQGCSHLFNVGSSADVQAAIDVCRCLGAQISGDCKHLIVNGYGLNPVSVINCGESGLGIRMFAAIASTFPTKIELTGRGSLLNRPMGFVADGLQKLGVECSTTNGFLPITICGPMLGGKISIDCSQSSQALTGLLMAAPFARSPIEISVENLVSKSYVDLTVELMHQFGVQVDTLIPNTYTIRTPQTYKPIEIDVEGDWSGAAFWLVAGAIAGKIEITNLNINSHQADVAVVNALTSAGAKVQVKPTGVCVERSNLVAFDFDATHCPDLFPPLVALAAHCCGTSRISGVERLRGKESDRAAVLVEEFAKMGIAIDIERNTMLIAGGTPKAASVSSHNDHRIAMACAICALASAGAVMIDDAQAVNKSYPTFWEEMEVLQIKNI